MSNEQKKRRVFLYKDQRFDDPGEDYSDDQVLKIVSASIPELAGGSVTRVERDDCIEVEMSPKAKRLG